MSYLLTFNKRNYKVVIDRDNLNISVNETNYKISFGEIKEHIQYCTTNEDIVNFLTYYLDKYDMTNITFFETDNSLILNIKIIFPPFTDREVEFILVK